MKLFVSALEYSANVHLCEVLREIVKCGESVELCGIFDEKMVGNSVLGMQFRTCENFGESTDSSLVLSPKFSQIQKPHRNHFDCDSLRKSTTNRAKIAESSDKIKSKKSFKSFCYFWLIPKVESPLPLNPNLLVARSATKSRPLRGAKNRIQASSSASADFLLEAEKRGSPPKSEKRQLLARRGSGAGGAALLREESSENSGEGVAESHNDGFNITGKSLCDTNSIAVMGFIDVLKKAKFFLDLRKKCLNLALAADKILLMDSSSFNIPLAKRIKKRDETKQIIYYILPQVWAWKPWRAKAIEANCDRLAAILPFEVGFYKEKAKFVGHPLLDEIKAFRVGNSPLELHSADFANLGRFADFSPVSHPKFAKNHESQTENPSVVDSALGAESSGKYAKFAESTLDSANSTTNAESTNKSQQTIEGIAVEVVGFLDDFGRKARLKSAQCPKSSKSTQDAPKSKLQTRVAESSNIFSFMPGSRMSEIKRIFPIFTEVKDALKSRDKDAKFHLIIPQKFASQNLAQIYGNVSDFHISFDAHRSLFQSRFAFICSGTATLECALIGTPFVLGYKCRALEAFVARCFLNVKFIGLANILYEKISPNETFHTELIQGDLSAQNLLSALDSANENDFLQKSLALRKYLKGGSASAVAKMLYGL